jgi:hypothetical protein
MNTYLSCSWCHASNLISDPELDTCACCGHRAAKPRMHCDCVCCRSGHTPHGRQGQSLPQDVLTPEDPDARGSHEHQR